MSRPTLPRPSLRPTPVAALVALLVVVLLGVSACGGSALDPKYVRAANDAVAGTSTGVGTGSVPGSAVDPGTGTTAVDPGTGTAGTGGGTGATGGGTTTGAGSAGSGGSGGAGGGSGPAAGSGTRAGSCTGFKNSTGITNDTITLGNAADVSGPVPGLFEAPQLAVKAYIAYFNTTHPQGICGRKLALTTADSRTDAGANQQAYAKFCAQTFAAVGSMSVFDSGGAQDTERCGLPDIRTTATTAARNGCSTCFGAQATGAYEYSNAIPDFFLKNYHAASQKAAYLYLNAGAAAENALTQIAVEKKRGMKFLYTSSIDVSDFNYGPYVQQMKSKGVQWLQFIGGYQQAVRLTQAMQSGDFRPQVIHMDQTTDDPGFIKSGGSSVEGVITSLTYKPFFENAPELMLYKRWLGQVSPGAVANGYGMFGWSAAKLFVEQALALGGGLTRPALVAKMRAIHAWTGGGMHGPMDVGGKHTAECVRFEQVRNGKFVPIGPRTFLCTGITKVPR